ncbi:MAG: hypothetical protein ACXWCY_25220 [Burkholderiales bacterium]
MLKKLIFAVLLALPFAAWAFVKPVRVLAPELEGLTCIDRVCVDDSSRRAEAVTLYQDAIQYVQTSVGPLQTAPRAVFCSTRACSKKFGFTHQNAYTVATISFVISDHGWHAYFIRHELIHHLQNEHLGSLRAWLFKPAWFREGMAYSVSEDPRDPLPEPLQGYRSRFEIWLKRVGPARLWVEAEHL